jgi:hypothetical protein
MLIGAVLALAVAIAVPVFAAGTQSGTFSMNEGSSLRVTCPNALTNVNVGSHSETVNCAPNSPPMPPPATTTTAEPVTTTTKPSGGYTCTVNGSLPPGGAYDSDPNIFNSNGYNTYVQSNIWARINIKQTTCAKSPRAFYTTATAADDGGAVQSYPSFKQGMGDGNGDPYALASFKSLTSTFNTTSPPDDQGNWEAAFDIWLDNPSGHDEIMIWTDTSNERGTGGAVVLVPHVLIGGLDFKLMAFECDPSSPCFTPQLVLNENADVGSVDILAALKYLMTVQDAAGKPIVDGASTIGELDFGIEWCHTDGQPLTWKVNDFTLNVSR